jgi:hypothetical protein
MEVPSSEWKTGGFAEQDHGKKYGKFFEFFGKPIAKNEKIWYHNAVCKDQSCLHDRVFIFYGGTYK